MLRRQRPVPFSFEAVQPFDIEGWIEINALPCCRGYLDGAEDVNVHHGRSASNGRDHADQHHCAEVDDSHHDYQPRTASAQDGIPAMDRRPHTGNGEALSIDFSGEFTMTGQKAVAQVELLRARDALANAVAAIRTLPDTDPTKAELDPIMNTARAVEDSSRRLQPARPADHLDTKKREISQRPRRSQTVDSGASEGDSCCDGVPGSDVSNCSSNMPAPLAGFFECAREVNMLQERLSEYRFALEEQKGTEALAGEAGLLASTDIEGPELKAMQIALSAARERASEQRALCLEQGINPEAFRYRRSSDASA